MKKIVMLCILFFFLNNEVGYGENINNKLEHVVRGEQIENKLIQDVTVRFISPYVHEAMGSHYMTDYLTEMFNTAPSMNRIVRVERVGNVNDFEFMLTVVSTGFVGKNIPVVDGQITFRVKGPLSGGGKNSVYFEGFKQLKTYDLPEQWKYIIKKPLE
jgi:hypothetical protein